MIAAYCSCASGITTSLSVSGNKSVNSPRTALIVAINLASPMLAKMSARARISAAASGPLYSSGSNSGKPSTRGTTNLLMNGTAITSNTCDSPTC